MFAAVVLILLYSDVQSCTNVMLLWSGLPTKNNAAGTEYKWLLCSSRLLSVFGIFACVTHRRFEYSGALCILANPTGFSGRILENWTYYRTTGNFVISTGF